MNIVPNMISTKDLAYLADMFEWNFAIAKLAHHFSQKAESTEVKAMMTNVYEMHHAHCKTIDTILGGGQSE